MGRLARGAAQEDSGIAGRHNRHRRAEFRRVAYDQRIVPKPRTSPPTIYRWNLRTRGGRGENRDRQVTRPEPHSLSRDDVPKKQGIVSLPASKWKGPFARYFLGRPLRLAPTEGRCGRHRSPSRSVLLPGRGLMTFAMPSVPVWTRDRARGWSAPDRSLCSRKMSDQDKELSQHRHRASLSSELCTRAGSTALFDCRHDVRRCLAGPARRPVLGRVR